MSLNRITIFTAEFPPQPGGIGNHAYNLANGLKKKGYQVKVLCDRRSEDGEEERIFDASLDFEVIRIPRRKLMLLSYLHRIMEASKLAKNCEIFIASGKFQLWMGGFLSLLKQNTNIAVIHGSELLLPNQFLRKLTDRSLGKFDKVVAVSNYTRSLVSSHVIENVEVIHNGFSMQCEGDQKKEKPLSPILVTVGNVTQRKGQHNVIASLPLLRKRYPEIEYHIIGIPTEKKKLQNLATELKVEKAVKFYGAVQETEKCNLLLTSNIFMMLSETTYTGDVEGFGIAILEANSLGIPSIGAKGCGIEEAIKDGYSGFLVNNKEPEEILTSIEHIMENYVEFSQNARNWSANFSWDRVINRYVEIIGNK